MRIVTDRLEIGYISDGDFEDVCEYMCDEEIGIHMHCVPRSEIEVKVLIDISQENMKVHALRWFEFVLRLKSENKVIGSIAVDGSKDEAEIGYLLNKNYWSRGYMSEALDAVINYIFKNTDIHRINAVCFSDNRASYRVLEKCGMKRKESSLDKDKLMYYIEKI